MWKLNNRGNVAITFALCMPLVLGGATFGVVVGFWRYDQVRLQQAADAASYAAAVVKRAGGTDLTGAATDAATSNGFNAGSDTLVVNTPSTATPGDPDSVEAVITRTETPYLSALFMKNPEVIRTSSTASYSTAGDACILALSKTAGKAADFAGNSSLTLNGCSVMSNSLASNALNVQGSAAVSAPCMYSVGGASLGGTVSLTTCSAVKTGQPPVADPYASWTFPTTPSGNCKNLGKGATPQAGTLYCGIDVKGTETLSSGTYYVDSQGLSLEANANLTCAGCTFVLVDGGGVSMNGNSTTTLSAPTSGANAGMLIVSAHGNTSWLTINGNNSSSVTGAIYAPDGSVSYLGNYAGTSGCTQIVAQTVAWSGDTTFADNCAAYGMSPVHVGSVVRLSA